MREIHDIRKMIAEETKNLSPEERTELTNKEGSLLFFCRNIYTIVRTN